MRPSFSERRNVTARPPRARVQNLARRPPAPFFRIFALGMLGVAACIWALVRVYTRKEPPQLAPPASQAPAETREIPAPDLAPQSPP